MSIKMNKPLGFIFSFLFLFSVLLVGQTVAQEDVVIGEPVTTGELFVGDVVGVEEDQRETAVNDIDVITGSGLDNYVFLPIVSKSFLLAQEQAVLTLINAERARAGCGPLVAHRQLVQAARGHSIDMAVNDYFSHTSQDGRSPWDRMADAGYTSFSRAGENIAAGQSTAARVVNGWMSSSGHRANILNCRFTETGIGYHYIQNDNLYYYHYWTQNFARP